MSAEPTYAANSKHRLKRIEGQIRGVLSMMEEERECRDVIVQLSAIRAAVDRLMIQVIGVNMEQCVRADFTSEASVNRAIEEAIQLLQKTR